MKVLMSNFLEIEVAIKTDDKKSQHLNSPLGGHFQVGVKIVHLPGYRC